MTAGADFSMLDLFREEARAHAAALSQGLLELERDAASPQRIEPLMRAAHSLKGAARIVGIDAAVRLAHALEDLFVNAQRGHVRITPALIDGLLQGTDILASLGEVTEATAGQWSETHATAVDAAIQRLASGASTRSDRIPAVAVEANPLKRVTASAPSTYQPPPPQALSLPPEPIPPGEHTPLWDLFREELRVNVPLLSQTGPTGEAAARAIKGAALINQVASVARLARALESCLAGAREGQAAPSTLTSSCLGRVAELLAELVPLDLDAFAAWEVKHTAELEQVEQALGAALEPSELGPAPSRGSTDWQSVPPPAVPPPARTNEPEAVVRVTAQSLNRLMSLAGESLVQARWLQPFSAALQELKKQMSATGGEPTADSRQPIAALADRIAEFDDHAARAENLNTRLYHEVIVSRMRPFADGTQGFPRLVRDMARQLGKQVKFEVLGQTTEVDRDVLDKLEAPLTHLLRNAVDHGCETQAERQAAGKPESATLRLEARHRAGMLAITVSDDGRGIDLAKLRQKIVERGLTTAPLAQAMRPQEVLEFLFLPGFSTAAQVTEFSGRGVGLDVVQDTVRKVGGSVHITTELGHGTRFNLQLPITLSVIRGVLVSIAGEPYALPHTRIDRLLRVERSEVRSLEHRQFITIDGMNIGLVLAAQLLELPLQQTTSSELSVVLLSDGGLSYGLIVDAFAGEQDLVVRPLDPRLGKVPGISSAAILDNGAPVLIADVEDLLRGMDRYIQTGTLQRWEPAAGVARVRKRILVADDSIIVRELERQILVAAGYEVAVAVDGKDAWNLIRQSPFDLLITDVDMPHMTGLELVRAVRGDGRLKDLPVVIVSYKERTEDRLRGLEVGANSYLTKSSFHDNTFVQAVRDLIG